jgi:hypothetical protein
MKRPPQDPVKPKNPQMLDHDLEEAEEQHQQAARAHLVIVDQVAGGQADY